MIDVGDEFYIMHIIPIMNNINYVAHKFVCTEVEEYEWGRWIGHSGGGCKEIICYPNLEDMKKKLSEIHARKKVVLEGKRAELEQQIENISKYSLEVV